LADLPNRTIDAVICVEAYVAAPDPLDNLLSAYELTPLLHQQEQNLHRNALDLERTAGTAQFIRTQIEFEILSKLDRFRKSRMLRSHLCTRQRSEFYVISRNVKANP